MDVLKRMPLVAPCRHHLLEHTLPTHRTPSFLPLSFLRQLPSCLIKPLGIIHNSLACLQLLLLHPPPASFASWYLPSLSSHSSAIDLPCAIPYHHHVKTQPISAIKPMGIKKTKEPSRHKTPTKTPHHFLASTFIFPNAMKVPHGKCQPNDKRSGKGAVQQRDYRGTIRQRHETSSCRCWRAIVPT